MSAVVQPKSGTKSARAHFQWDDPFLLDEQLTDDERMIRDTARDYAQEKPFSTRRPTARFSTRWARLDCSA
jgi:hypothetical protein